MSTRKLPRAASRTMDEIRRSSAEERPAQQPARTRVTLASVTANPRSPSRRIEPETDTAAAPAPMQDAGLDAELRRSQAREIIQRHTVYAAVGGIVPVPWLDAAVVGGIVASMLGALSRHYGEPLDRNRSRRLAATLIGAVGAPGISSLIASTLLRATGANVAGTMVSSATAATLTSVIGQVFMERHESGTAAASAAPPAVA